MTSGRGPFSPQKYKILQKMSENTTIVTLKENDMNRERFHMYPDNLFFMS